MTPNGRGLGLDEQVTYPTTSAYIFLSARHGRRTSRADVRACATRAPGVVHVQKSETSRKLAGLARPLLSPILHGLLVQDGLDAWPGAPSAAAFLRTPA
jgi:hypothetical protein